MNKELDQQLNQLKNLESEIKALEDLKTKVRTELFEVLEKEEIGQYKNDIATVSYVERKTVKYEDKENILKKLEEDKLPKYYDVIPETKAINKKFEEDIKSGDYKVEGVNVEIKKLPQIRFNK